MDKVSFYKIEIEKIANDIKQEKLAFIAALARLAPALAKFVPKATQIGKSLVNKGVATKAGQALTKPGFGNTMKVMGAGTGIGGVYGAIKSPEQGQTRLGNAFQGAMSGMVLGAGTRALTRGMTNVASKATVINPGITNIAATPVAPAMMSNTSAINRGLQGINSYAELDIMCIEKLAEDETLTPEDKRLFNTLKTLPSKFVNSNPWIRMMITSIIGAGIGAFTHRKAKAVTKMFNDFKITIPGPVRGAGLGGSFGAIAGYVAGNSKIKLTEPNDIEEDKKIIKSASEEIDEIIKEAADIASAMEHIKKIVHPDRMHHITNFLDSHAAKLKAVTSDAEKETLHQQGAAKLKSLIETHRRKPGEMKSSYNLPSYKKDPAMVKHVSDRPKQQEVVK